MSKFTKNELKTINEIAKKKHISLHSMYDGKLGGILVHSTLYGIIKSPSDFRKNIKLEDSGYQITKSRNTIVVAFYADTSLWESHKSTNLNQLRQNLLKLWN